MAPRRAGSAAAPGGAIAPQGRPPGLASGAVRPRPAVDGGGGGDAGAATHHGGTPIPRRVVGRLPIADDAAEEEPHLDRARPPLAQGGQCPRAGVRGDRDEGPCHGRPAVSAGAGPRPGTIPYHLPAGLCRTTEGHAEHQPMARAEGRAALGPCHLEAGDASYAHPTRHLGEPAPIPGRGSDLPGDVDPEHVRMAAPLLGHASFTTTERHYILAKNRNALRLHQETIMARRAALRRRRQDVDVGER